MGEDALKCSIRISRHFCLETRCDIDLYLATLKRGTPGLNAEFSFLHILTAIYVIKRKQMVYYCRNSHIVSVSPSSV